MFLVTRYLLPHDRSVRVAALLIVPAAACFALMIVLARQMGQKLDPMFLVAMRGGIGACLLIPYLFLNKIPTLGTHRRILIFRAMVGALGVALTFLTAKWIPAAEALSLMMSSALFVPFWAALLFKEKIHARLLCIIGLGFFGVLLVVQPGFAQLNRGVLYGLGTAIVHSVVYITLRGLSTREHPLTVVLYFLGGSAVFCAPFATFPVETPEYSEVLKLLLLILSGFVGQILMTHAYSHAPASVVTPYLYSEVVFAALLGWLLLAESPNLSAILGMLLICLAGIAIGRIRVPDLSPTKI